MIKKVYRFIKYNDHKKLWIQAYYYTAIFSFMRVAIPAKYFRRTWGEEFKESSFEESEENIRFAKEVGYVVGMVSKRTKWQSACLIRALSAQRMIAKKNIKTTMYIGFTKTKDGDQAHAWLRCGNAYITGGTGDGFIVLTKFLR